MTVPSAHRGILALLVFLPLALWPAVAASWYPRTLAQSTLANPQPGQQVGVNRPYVVGPGETLMEIAYHGGLGFQALTQTNPGLDPWAPPVGLELTLPYAALLPPGIAPGITVNLAEYRLYLLWQEGPSWQVRIYPIGLAREGRETPEGDFSVICRVPDPLWTPPAALRAEKPELPLSVPAGPDNPLGRYWIGLSTPGVGIHGTNQPYGIGRRVSFGCIRLYPRDIEDLVERVAIGTPVRILYQPFKVGIDRDRLLVEAHPDFLDRVSDPAGEIRRQARALGWPEELPVSDLLGTLQESRGTPVPLAFH